MSEQADSEKSKLTINNLRGMFSNLRRINTFVWASARGLVLARCLVTLLSSVSAFLLSGATALFINELIQLAGSGQSSPALVLAGALLILVTVLPTFLFPISDFLFRMLWYLIDERLVITLAARSSSLDMAHHEDPKIIDLIKRVDDNGIWRTQETADRQFQLLENIIAVVVAVAILAVAGWWILLLILVGTIPEFLSEVRHGKQIWGIWNSKVEIRRRYWDLRWRFTQANELAETKVFQSANYFLNMMEGLYQTFRAEERRAQWVKLFDQSISRVMSQAAIGLALICFMYQVINGSLQIGTFVFYSSAIVGLRSALSGLFMNLGRMVQDHPFVSDVFEVLDLPSVVEAPANPQPLSVTETPEIVFDRVSFGYPGTTDMVLKDLSLTISAGEKLAIVGINGAGKTTLVKLLCRFYDPTEGRVSVGGVDLQSADLDSWYSQLGVLFQQYAHYKFPVRELIALGRSDQEICDERIVAAARESGAAEYIEKWEGGFDQMVGREFTDGKELSVGQWQKLALARLFYRDPKVMVLDEPTASMDAEAEEKVFEHLGALPEDRTVILISHRFSTVRRADRIIVLDGGRLLEQGSHEELMEARGRYEKLFSLQAKGYK